jgi:hypothetical protein
MKARVSNPTHISPAMFDQVVIEKFQENTADEAVRAQALTLIRLLRQSGTRSQIIADILHAATKSGHKSPETIAEIAFAMGTQFGYELGLSCPPIS